MQFSPRANRTTDLRERAAEAMERFQVPGVAIAVIHDDAEHVETLGVTNVEHPLPVDGDTIFRVNSVTKTLVAMAAMRLVEAGRLELDAPVRTYLHDAQFADADVAQRLSMRHLLTHAGGWQDTPDGDPEAPLSAITGIVGALPQLRPLGSWSYCNSGLMLAGRAIEVLAEQPFEQAMRTLVLDPLDMSHSCFDPGEMITHRVAAGHVLAGITTDGKGITRAASTCVVRPWREPRWTRPSVGLGTTISDLVRYVRVQLDGGLTRDGGRLLEEDSLRALHGPATEDGQLGLTWLLRRVGDVDTVSLGGAGLGFGSHVLMAPEQRFGLVTLTNAGGHAFDRELRRWALREYLDVLDDAVSMQLDEETLRAYVGRYVGEHQVLEITARGGGLVLRSVRTSAGVGGAAGRPESPQSQRLKFYEPDRVAVAAGARSDIRGEFLRDENGAVVMFRFPTLLHVRESGEPDG